MNPSNNFSEQVWSSKLKERSQAEIWISFGHSALEMERSEVTDQPGKGNLRETKINKDNQKVQN